MVATYFLLVSLKSLLSQLAWVSRLFPTSLSQETAGGLHCHGIFLHRIAVVQHFTYFTSYLWKESTWIRTLKYVTKDFCAVSCAISSGDFPTRGFLLLLSLQLFMKLLPWRSLLREAANKTWQTLSFTHTGRHIFHMY